MINQNAIDWNEKVTALLKEDSFLNICHEALDRQLQGLGRHSTALRYVPPTWSTERPQVIDISYEKLTCFTYKFANALKKLGIKKGDVLFSLSPRIPELYTVALGTFRLGAVFSPLFPAFGPGPISARMSKGKAKAIFSQASLFRKKVLPSLNSLPTLEHIILIDDDGSLKDVPGAIDFFQLMGEADSSPIIEKTQPLDTALLHFTSGTTGEPKGAVHVHQAVVYHKVSGQFALNLRPNDVFWCTADPGWVTGTSYGIISPLCNGATLLIDGAEFNATRWYEILKYFKVDVWYSAPTAMRMLMKAGEELPRNYVFSHIRFASSVGEPLNPEVIKWVKENLHITLHDNWWQTETGGIIVANDARTEVRPGSMGKPLPGIEVALIKDITNDKISFAANNEQGEIAIRKGWPSMFTAYLENPERYSKCFVGDWYLSGDLAQKDEDGYYWFVGRKDDVIKTSGHLIGPFEVENVLMDHPAVLESAVIGIPDPVIGEMIKGYVVLKRSFAQSEEQKLEILAHARKKLGAALAPREIQFIDNLPKTRSGKIMRRLLKARELGLPEGDLSTLESDSGAR
jgi:acetyl-CoA synthetase